MRISQGVRHLLKNCLDRELNILIRENRLVLGDDVYKFGFGHGGWLG